MTIFSTESRYVMKKSNSETKTAGDSFTDKRVFTDKTMIKTENGYLNYTILLLDKKRVILRHKQQVIILLISDCFLIKH